MLPAEWWLDSYRGYRGPKAWIAASLWPAITLAAMFKRR
jgi:hypothetical protein